MIVSNELITYYLPPILFFNSACDTSISVPRTMLYAACIDVATSHHLYLLSTVLLLVSLTSWCRASGGGVQPLTLDLHLLRGHRLHVDIVLHANPCQLN